MLGTLASIASAVFAYLAWRTSVLQNKVGIPYLTGYRHTGELPRLQGNNADQWEIVSVRLLWPIRSAFFKQEGAGLDDDGVYQPGHMVSLGRKMKAPVDRLIVSGHSSPLLLFKIALKSAPSTCRFRLVRQSRKP